MLAFCHDGLCSLTRNRRGAVLGLPIYLESPGKMQSDNNKSLLPHLGQNTLIHRYIVYTPKFIDKTKNLVIHFIVSPNNEMNITIIQISAMITSINTKL